MPSTSRLLLDSDLFRVIGRMIGHSFLHGGPLLTGLSRSLFNLLLGQKDEPAVLELEDCPDTDVTEIVSLVSLKHHHYHNDSFIKHMYCILHAFSVFKKICKQFLYLSALIASRFCKFDGR